MAAKSHSATSMAANADPFSPYHSVPSRYHIFSRFKGSSPTTSGFIARSTSASAGGRPEATSDQTM